MKVSDNANDAFFNKEDVTKSKDAVLKIRYESVISSLGLSQREFYEKAGITRQRWYAISWGIEPCPNWLKVKLCNLFGKPFIDFFLNMDYGEVKDD